MIDYQLVVKALDSYKQLGYQYIEAPWMVTAKAQYATMPKELQSFAVVPHRHGDVPAAQEPSSYLVGSAEQGIIQMLLDGKLTNPGWYVTGGPCFRNEPVLDEYRKQTFFKVELTWLLDDSAPQSEYSQNAFAQGIASHASYVFCEISGKIASLVKTDIGYDLEMNGVEVGSYGYREFEGHRWIYGTGLALPRFTQVMAVK